FRIGRIVELDVKNRCLAAGTDQILESLNRYEFASSPAVLDDSRDSERMVQDLHRVTDLHMPLSGNVVVHEGIVGSLERATCDVLKWAAESLKTVDVDAIDYFQTAPSRNLPNDRADHGDVWHLLQDIRNFN